MPLSPFIEGNGTKSLSAFVEQAKEEFKEHLEGKIPIGIRTSLSDRGLEAQPQALLYECIESSGGVAN